MNKRTLLTWLTYALVAIPALWYFFWNTTPLNPHIVRIHKQLYLEKQQDEYAAFYTASGYRGQTRKKVIATRIDSVIISHKYGTMIYGEDAQREKGWFYVDVSPSTNVYGGYSDAEFRKNNIESIGRIYLDSVCTPQVIWERYKHTKK